MTSHAADPQESGGHVDFTRRQLLERGATVGGSLLAAEWLAACGGNGQSGAVTSSKQSRGAGKTVEQMHWVIQSDPQGIDYAFSYDFNSNPVVTNICEALVRFTPDGRLVPHLATSWDTPDPTTYVYHIRPNVRFHDGTVMTAEDVAFSLSRIGDPKVASLLAAFDDRVKSIRATGPLEVTVRLTQPDSIWQFAAATQAGAVASKAFLQKHGSSVGKPGVGIVATGPYRYVSWTPGQEIVLERFADYWDKSRPLKVKRLVFNILAAETTIVEALSAGSVDGTFASSSLSGRNIAAVSQLPNMRVFATPSYTVHYIIINTKRKPFSDPRVRQALSYAIDKAGILASVWKGQGSLSKSPAPPALFSYAKDVFGPAYNALNGFSLDVKKGAALVKAAGATGASASILVGTDFEQQSGLIVQAAGKAIGLNLRLEKTQYTQKAAEEFSGKPRTYDMSISEWGSDFPDPAGSLVLPFYSGNPVTDDSQYQNATVDRLLQSARAEPDPTKRATFLTEAQTIIANDQPWIVLYNPLTQMAVNKRLGGYQLRPMWYWDAWAADFSGT